MTPRRVLETFIAPALIALAFVVPAGMWRDRLPDPIASHWGPGGAPDGAMAMNSSLWLFLTIWITLWVGLVILLRVQQVGGTEARFLVATIYWTGGLFLAVWTLGLEANLDVVDWQNAADLPAWKLFAAMLGALPLGALGWLLAKGRVGRGPAIGEAVQPLTSEDGRATLWSSTATNPVLTLVAALPVAVTGLMALLIDGAWVALAIAAGASLVISTIGTRVRATVGPNGIRISMGWFGWPARTIGVDDITEVRVEDVAPMSYGGWGFRMARGAQAHVIRRGEAIRVERRSGSAVVVTVDDAERGAAILAGHLEGRNAPTDQSSVPRAP